MTSNPIGDRPVYVNPSDELKQKLRDLLNNTELGTLDLIWSKEEEKMDDVQVIRHFMKSVGQNTPDSPTEPTREEKLLRAKLILEEAIELINSLGVSVSSMVPQGELINSTEDLYFNNDLMFDMVGVVDGCCDLYWVGVGGVAVSCGFSLREPLDEVNRSNLSKIDNGYRREDGKWVKGKNYSPAKLDDKVLPICFTTQV